MNAERTSGRVARKRAALRSAILARALDHLSVGDWPTMVALADQADCSIGTLYSHFRSMDDVIAGLEDAYFAKIGSALAQVAQKDAAQSEQIADTALALFRFAQTDRRFCASYFELGQRPAVTKAAFGSALSPLLSGDASAERLPFTADAVSENITIGAIQAGLFSIYHDIASSASLKEVVRCVLVSLGDDQDSARKASNRTPPTLQASADFSTEVEFNY